MEYLCPPGQRRHLIPPPGVSQEAADRAQWALHLTLENRMRIRRAMTRSVKDCFKVGIGLGIVEPITITPADAFTISAGGNKTRMMMPGRAVRSLRYRYLSPGKVLPYPAGVDFNGDDPVPYTFLLDMYSAELFRLLFKARAEGTMDDVQLRGDPKAMIAEAKTRGFDSGTSFVTFMNKMKGRNSYAGSGPNNLANASSMVPVLKVYGHTEKRMTWIFPGAEWNIIWDKSGTQDTQRNNLIKFDPWIDADRFYPMSMPEGAERGVWQANILTNAINDLISQALRRPAIYDTNVFPDGPPDFGPQGVTGAAGATDKAWHVLEASGADQTAFQMLEKIEQIHTRTTGEQNMTDRNYTRGGSQAFQELLNSTTGRQRLRHALLETGGYTDILKQVFMYMQTLADEMDMNFAKRSYSRSTGGSVTEWIKVSPEDLRHAYELDLDPAARDGAMDIASRIQLFSTVKDDPYVHQRELRELLFPDPYLQDRLLLSREEADALQEQRTAAQIEGMRGGAETEGSGIGGGTPEAIAGGRTMGGAPAGAPAMAGAGA